MPATYKLREERSSDDIYNVTETAYGRKFESCVQINHRYCINKDTLGKVKAISVVLLIPMCMALLIVGLSGSSIEGNCFKVDYTGTDFDVTYNSVKFYPVSGEFDKKCTNDPSEIARYRDVLCDNVTKAVGGRMIATMLDQLNTTLDAADLIERVHNYRFGRDYKYCITHHSSCDGGHGLPIRKIPITVEANYSMTITRGNQMFDVSCITTDFNVHRRNRFKCDGKFVNSVERFYDNDPWTPRAVYDDNVDHIDDDCTRLVGATIALGVFAGCLIATLFMPNCRYRGDVERQINPKIEAKNFCTWDGNLSYKEFLKYKKFCDQFYATEKAKIENQIQMLQRAQNEVYAIYESGMYDHQFDEDAYRQAYHKFQGIGVPQTPNAPSYDVNQDVPVDKDAFNTHDPDVPDI